MYRFYEEYIQNYDGDSDILKNFNYSKELKKKQ